MLEGFSKILKTLNNSNVYSKKPPYGPPDEYPTIAKEELINSQIHNGFFMSIII